MAKLTFTAPPVAPVDVELVGSEMYRDKHPRQAGGIRLHLLTDTGEVRTEWVGGEEGQTLIGVINTRDFRTQSMEEVILRWLVNNRPGYQGTVTP